MKHPWPLGQSVLLALLALLEAGCAKCGRQARDAGSIEALLPRGALAVAVVPRLETLGAKINVLSGLKAADFAAQLKGLSDSQALADGLMEELGVDVRSLEALERSGVDGQRPAAAALLLTGSTYLVLPVKDARKFHLGLERLAARRLGTAFSDELAGQGAVVKTFSVQKGASPRVGYTLRDGFALVATDDGISGLGAVATMGPADALVADEELKRALGRAPRGHDAYVWIPNGSPLLARGPVSSALVSVALTPKALTITGEGSWKGEASELAMLQRREGPDLLGLLPRDAFVVARYSADPAALAPLAEAVLGAGALQALEAQGLHLKAHLLDQLESGVVAALSVADRPPLDRGMPSFESMDFRKTNPVSYVHFTGVAQVRTPDAGWPALEKLAAVAPRFGAQMEASEREGAQVMLTSYAQGEGLHFGVKSDRIFFASPVQRLDALLRAASVPAPAPAPAQPSESASPVDGLSPHALSLAIDLRKLSDSIRALPDSAWGIGGFAIKSTTVRWLEAVRDVKTISVALSAQGRVLQGQFVLSLDVPNK